MTTEEKIEQVKDLRPIDDVFFEVLAEDKDVCQEILRIIMDDDQLIVSDVIVQSSERNIYGRSVRLDALCYISYTLANMIFFMETARFITLTRSYVRQEM